MDTVAVVPLYPRGVLAAVDAIPPSIVTLVPTIERIGHQPSVVAGSVMAFESLEISVIRFSVLPHASILSSEIVPVATPVAVRREIDATELDSAEPLSR